MARQVTTSLCVHTLHVLAALKLCHLEAVAAHDKILAVACTGKQLMTRRCVMRGCPAKRRRTPVVPYDFSISSVKVLAVSGVGGNRCRAKTRLAVTVMSLCERLPQRQQSRCLSAANERIGASCIGGRNGARRSISSGALDAAVSSCDGVCPYSLIC